MALWTSPARLWLNQDKTKVVADGDPEAAFLLAAEGAEIDLKIAQEHDLVHGPIPTLEQDQPEAEIATPPVPIATEFTGTESPPSENAGTSGDDGEGDEVTEEIERIRLEDEAEAEAERKAQEQAEQKAKLAQENKARGAAEKK